MNLNKIRITILFGALLLVVFAASLLLVHNNSDDKTFIQRNYSQIQIPSALQFKMKTWADRSSQDPQIPSVWNYVYTFSTTNSPPQVDKELEATLKSSGFRIGDHFKTEQVGEYSFEASSNKLHLSVFIGYNARMLTDVALPGQYVYLTVSRATD